MENRHTLLCLRNGATTTITNGMPSGTLSEADTDGDSTGADGAPAAKAGDDDDGGESDGEPAPRPPHQPLKRPRKAINRAPLTSAHTEKPSDAAPPAQTAPPPRQAIQPLLRLPEVLSIIPVSRSSWYDGMQTGRYPAPVKIGPRAVAWRSADILSDYRNPEYQDTPHPARPLRRVFCCWWPGGPSKAWPCSWPDPTVRAKQLLLHNLPPKHRRSLCACEGWIAGAGFAQLAYKHHPRKKPAIFKIVGFPWCTWWDVRGSNPRQTD